MTWVQKWEVNIGTGPNKSLRFLTQETLKTLQRVHTSPYSVSEIGIHP